MQEGGPLESCSMTECCTPQVSSNTLPESSSSSGKFKKRERTDDADEGKGVNCPEEYESPKKRECLKVDVITSVTDEDGRLPDVFAVDQLIHMMQEAESCTQRGMLCDSLVLNMKEDCMQHFIRMGGVMILDEWLQDGYKAARSGDADTAVNKVVATILEALEKLPINMDISKGCNIGKSVNHLCSHKNGEIQKKARMLVDAWKKRADFEIKNTPYVGSDNANKKHSIRFSVKPNDITDTVVGIDESRKFAMQEGSFTPVVESTSPTEVASPNLSTVTLNRKSDTMTGKDTGNNDDQDCPSSTTTLLVQSDEGENGDNNMASGNPASCKNEVSNQEDLQHSEGKHSRNGNSNSKNDHPNGLTSSSAAANVKERTNEYRKKLRSSGSRTLPCSSDSHSNTAHANAACHTHESAKVTDLKENKTSGDDGVGSQKQLSSNTKERPSGKSHKVESLEKVENMGHDLSVTRCTGKEDNAALKDEKVDSLKSLSVSRTSTCTEKQRVAGSLSKKDGWKFTGNDAKNVDADMLQQQKQHALVDSMLKFTCSNSRKEITHDSSDNSECKFNENAVLKRTFFSLPERVSSLEREHDATSHTDATHLEAQSTNANNAGELGKDVSFFTNSDKNINAADRTNETIINSEKASQPTTDTIQTNGNSGTINLEGAVSHLRLNFDLNEGFAEEEFLKENISGFTTIESMSSSRLSTLVPVIAATKGAYFPPANIPNKCDTGWTGSAATSAFRPAPLKSVSAIERQTSVNQVRNVNNFDLNVPDQDIKEDYENTSSRYRQHGGGLDLNSGGEDMETDIQIPEALMQVSFGNPQRALARPPVLDFDLNEGPSLDEMHQEQIVHTSAINRWCNNIPLAGSNMPVISGDMPIWQTSCTKFPMVTINMPGRSDPACISFVAPQNMGLPQSSTTIVPPLLPSEVYSQTTPFLGGMPFISSSTHNPIPVVSDSSFVVPKVTTQASFCRSTTSRSTTSNSRPYMIDLEADVRGSNSFYTWGKQDQNAYDNTGPAIINYKDIGVNIKDHQDAGVMSMEEQLRLYQQAAVPVTSLKRKDSDYAAFPRSSWR